MDDDKTEDEYLDSTKSAEPLDSSSPERVGSYRILERLGEGGMGVVYLAEQTEPIRRKAALKIIKHGMDTKQVVARFEAERQALAMMDHPCVAKVFEAGSTEGGRPYFAMEYVKGVPITEHCDRQRLTTRERLELFQQVCDGVQHAHQKAIIHRDIKPSNVLVSYLDGKATPKIIDFGVAKAIEHKLTEKTLYTEMGVMIGTPEYMSPEQAEMTGQNVDTRTDVYSLGVMLYELLVGALPFESKELRRAGFDEIRRKIREDEPSKPSARLSTLDGERSTDSAKRRRTNPSTLRRQLSGDLDWIVMTALEKDRTRRYASASELTADIARHLGDEPIVARPPSTSYRVGKFVKKYKVGVAAVTAIFATIVVLGSAVGWQGRKAQLRGLQLQRKSILAFAESAQDPLLKALLIDEIADLPQMRGRLSVAREAANFPLPTAVFRHEGSVNDAAFSPDGEHVATASDDGMARVWRTDGTGEPIVLRGPDVGATHVAFSPDGRRLIAGYSDGQTVVWRADGAGEPIVLWGHTRQISDVAFSPDGTRVATASGDGTARLWNADGSGNPVALKHERSVWTVAFSPDGLYLATASTDATAWVRRVDGTGETIVLRHVWPVNTALFSPDGRFVLTTSTDGKGRVWPADGVGEPVVLKADSGRVWGGAFSPDGARVVTADKNGTVRVWSVDGSGDPVVLGEHDGGIRSASFSPDGSIVLTAGDDGTARLWRSNGSGEPVILRGHVAGVFAASFNADGTRVVTASGDGTARVWNTGDTGEAIVIRGHDSGVTHAAFSPDGARIVTTEYKGTSRIWRADGTGEPTVLGAGASGSAGPAVSASFHPDGTRVVTAHYDRTARVWGVDGREQVVLRWQEDAVLDAAFSPDGRLVATAGQDGTCRVGNADGTGEPLVLRGHQSALSSVAFSPDGTRVLTSSQDGTLRVWWLDESREPLILRGFGTQVFMAAFSPDGARVVSGSRDGAARIGNADGTGKPIVLRGHTLWVMVSRSAFSPDGTRVATASTDRTARIWQVDGTDEPLVLRGHEWGVLAAAFSPDGKRVVTGSEDGTVRIWRVTWPELRDYLRSRVTTCLTARQRMRYLAESPSEARTAFAACERRYGRKPEATQVEEVDAGDERRFREIAELAKAARIEAGSGTVVRVAAETRLVSDFEGSHPSAVERGWSVSTDVIQGGGSTSEYRIVAGGADGSKASMRINGEIEPGGWAGVMFYPGIFPWNPVDLSSKETIRFWAKGDGKTYGISLFVGQGIDSSAETFDTGSEWKFHTFPLADFEDIDPSELTGVFFGGSDEGEFSFRIDDVRFE